MSLKAVVDKPNISKIPRKLGVPSIINPKEISYDHDTLNGHRLVISQKVYDLVGGRHNIAAVAISHFSEPEAITYELCNDYLTVEFPQNTSPAKVQTFITEIETLAGDLEAKVA